MNFSGFITSEAQRTIAVIFFLLFCYLILPGPAYIAVLAFLVVIIPNFKSHLVATLTIFYFSFLIASRYSGIVWDGSDDLPSYFLAYDAITSGERDSISASFFYAKHLDIGFIALTKLINYLSGGNRFIYYFTLVFASFFTYYLFLFRALKGRYALFALLIFLLYFKNIHLSMHILRSSLAIPLILLSLTFTSNKKYIMFFFAGTFQASTAVLAALTLIPRDFVTRFSIVQKISFITLLVVSFAVIGQVYLFGKIVHARFSIGVGNYPIILANIVVGVSFIFISHKSVIGKDDGVKWIYFYVYFILVSLLSLVFSHHTYRFSQFILYLTPFVITLSVFSRYRLDYLQYVLAILYISGSYYTYYYILNLNESDFYYLQSSDILINGVSQILLFFDYVEMDVGYSSFWRVKGE
ncbi:EpsG family protein [Shewanella sp. 30m-9]